ncbi:MAG: PBP1A family penicillin-binding protein [Candidatus Campbellbacteria bacterium]|nr:PBP1A family penicillin-binding protein [Candidatus Campbellbacteria bacterium]
MTRKKHHPYYTAALLLLGLGALGAGVVLFWAASLRLPDFDVFEERKVQQSTKIYDRTGEVLLYDLHENIQRTVIPFDQISRNVKNATVAIEDAEFYQHHGIKWSSLFRAVLVNILSLQYSQGGSTITQQVVKNSLLTQEKTISRKLKEWVLALKLEQNLSKEEILALYLNETPYGGSVYGVEEASRTFFHKDASEITLSESAYLAALPQAPTFYSPYGDNVDKLEDRKNLVLSRMLEDKFITQEEYDTAKIEKVEFKPRPEKGLLAPHFVFYILQYLEQKYGQNALEEDGLRVITTLDYELQEQAEEIVREGALENEAKFKAENAGLVAVDPKTGQILVMVGSRDYFDTAIDGNVNIATAKRQPGSAFKPFVYATAFKKGITPETVLFDLPTQFSTACPVTSTKSATPCYYPENYDSKFRGPISIRSALAQSINIPAVKALYLAGITASIKTARDMGISTLADASRYGLTLVLGGGEVTLLDLTSAYGVFGNGGIRNETKSILKVERSDGTVLEQFSEHPSRVLEQNIARQISSILSDNIARTPSFGAASALYFPSTDVAVKTGTTNDYRDVWIIGYTPNIAVGAWGGNNDNTPIDKKVAGFVIAPLWHRFMDVALQKYPDSHFSSPEKSTSNKPVLLGIWQGGDTQEIDSRTGSPAKNNTPDAFRKIEVTQNVHDVLHWINTDDPTGPAPSNPSNDPQYAYWEYPVRAWAAQNGYSSGVKIITNTPLSTSNSDTGATSGDIGITGLKSSYQKDDTISLRLTLPAGYNNNQTEVLINNTVVPDVVRGSYSLSFPIDSDLTLEEENALYFIFHKTDGSKVGVTKSFSLK